jgi:hypothetical protein
VNLAHGVALANFKISPLQPAQPAEHLVCAGADVRIGVVSRDPEVLYRGRRIAGLAQHCAQFEMGAAGLGLML